MKPEAVFTAPKFHWSRYLQRHLRYSSVNVSDLHPIFGLRLSALFIRLVNDGLASDVVGQGIFQVSSGVRTKAEQIYLYNDICLRQGRCKYVANPYSPRSGGPDEEGVQRYGSNHMDQRQSPLWSKAWDTKLPIELGYAVDIRNNGAPWSELHRRLSEYGLDWPLKTGAVEPWHLEAFPDWSRWSEGWIPGPWPRRPGVHRPLFVGLIGGDVRNLQRQLGVPRADRDSVFGDETRRLVNRWQRKLNVSVTGTWATEDQRAWERWKKRQ